MNFSTTAERSTDTDRTMSLFSLHATLYVILLGWQAMSPGGEYDW
jgi:hypothetical protein